MIMNAILTIFSNDWDSAGDKLLNYIVPENAKQTLDNCYIELNRLLH